MNVAHRSSLTTVIVQDLFSLHNNYGKMMLKGVQRFVLSHGSSVHVLLLYITTTKIGERAWRQVILSFAITSQHTV